MRAVIFGCVLLLAWQAAAAQAIDDAWIRARVLTGQYEELRRVETESDRGSPVAMYWWASFLDACVFRCDEDAARALWLKAARAGHGEAKVAVMIGARSRAELDQLVATIGAPASFEERVGYAVALARVAVEQLATPSGSRPDSYGEAQRLTRELAATQPRVGLLLGVMAFEGPLRHEAALRAMVESGYPPAAENFRRSLLISGRVDYPQQLAMAQAGDIAVGVALCETVNVTQGWQELPADLLAICERALLQGYAGVVPALLRHHHHGSKNAGAAAFYAQLCVSLPIGCASDLADYYQEVSAKSPQWTLWDAVAGLSAGFPPSEAKLPVEVMQQVYTIRLRRLLAERACAARLYDAATRKVADDPSCPYRTKIEVPTEFIGGKR